MTLDNAVNNMPTDKQLINTGEDVTETEQEQ
jgi:hypothetical protein